MDNIQIIQVGKSRTSQTEGQFGSSDVNFTNAIHQVITLEEALSKGWIIVDQSTTAFSKKKLKIENQDELSASTGERNATDIFTSSVEPAKHLVAGRSSEMIHRCAVCDEIFACASSLHDHLKIHSKERPRICKDCNRAFSQLGNLIQHRRIHTGERPYPCGYCLKSFKQKSQVMQHERIHTGEKPYVCAVCQKAFVQLSQLRYHERTHTNKETADDGEEKYTKRRSSRRKGTPEQIALSSAHDTILAEKELALNAIRPSL